MDANTTALYALYVAFAALVLSVPVAWVQIAQYLRDSKNIAVSYRLVGIEFNQTIMEILNLSSTPALVNGWNLAWGKSGYLWINYTSIPNELYPVDSRLDLMPRIRKEVELPEDMILYLIGLSDPPPGAKMYVMFYLAGRETPNIVMLFDPQGPTNRIVKYLFH